MRRRYESTASSKIQAVAIRSQNGQSAADGSVATTMVLPAVLLLFRHIARWVDLCSKVWRIVELSTTASDAVDGMETGWAEPHFGGSDRPKWAKNTTLPRRGSQVRIGVCRELAVFEASHV